MDNFISNIMGNMLEWKDYKHIISNSVFAKISNLNHEHGHIKNIRAKTVTLFLLLFYQNMIIPYYLIYYNQCGII